MKVRGSLDLKRGFSNEKKILLRPRGRDGFEQKYEGARKRRVGWGGGLEIKVN